MLPATLRSSRALSCLSVVSVGLAMAAVTGAFFGAMFGGGAGIGPVAAVTALPTLVVGTAWAALLRSRRTVGHSNLRLGWLLSLPLASLNGGLAAALMLILKDHANQWLEGVAIGMTLGAVFWFPAMLVALTLFGVPIAWSQRQARRGLLGAERGEILVGAVCACLCLVVLLGLSFAREERWVPSAASSYRNVRVMANLLREGQAGAINLAALATLGLLTG
ncbi:MAG: hypothetical protein EOO75_17655, partial [Myxococcales bacterium]